MATVVIWLSSKWKRGRDPWFYVGFQPLWSYSSSSIEKGYEVYRRYICAADSSFMNCFLPSHDFTRELVVILLSRVTTSLCLENTCIASCLANCICFLEDLNQKRLIINLPMPISLAADTNYTAWLLQLINMFLNHSPCCSKFFS